MINLARPMVSYSFETSDPADSVATFYKNAMEHIYGFLNPTVEASRNGGYIVRGLRMALRDRWVLEIITVTITPVNASQTKVALTFEIREQY